MLLHRVAGFSSVGFYGLVYLDRTGFGIQKLRITESRNRLKWLGRSHVLAPHQAGVYHERKIWSGLKMRRFKERILKLLQYVAAHPGSPPVQAPELHGFD